MKKFITRSLFAFVIMGFSLVSVSAATDFTYEGWTAGNGYGTKSMFTDYITNVEGEYIEERGMYYGPFNKQSIQTLEDGIVEEVHVDLDFEQIIVPEFFEVSLALNDANGDYLDEAVVMTQAVEEGKFKITAGWAPSFEAVVTEDGIYTYRWEAYIENEKAYVKFNLVKEGEVVATTGAVEFAKLNADGVAVRYVWFCNINVDGGIYIYHRMPETTIDADTNSDDITIADAEKAEAVLGASAKVDLFARYDVLRYDTFITGQFEKMTKEEMLEEDEEAVKLFEDAIENDTIVNFFNSAFVVSVDEENYTGENPIIKYAEEIALNLTLPTDLPAVAKGYERKYYLIKADVADLYEKMMELLQEDPDAINDLDMIDLLELEVVEPTLSKDGKTLSFASDSYDMYALSYIDSELPPQTGDSIMTYVIIGIVSMLGLLVIALKGRKLFN